MFTTKKAYICSVFLIFISFNCINESKSEPIEGHECGIRKVKTNISSSSFLGRIVGGRDAAPHEYPWVVSLLIFSNKLQKVKLFCGGALLNRNLIITAAHCVNLFDAGYEEQLIIKFGTNHWKDGSSETRIASLVILHQNWMKKENKNDIALVMFDNPIDYKTDSNGNYIINNICLPPTNFKSDGFAILTGFGQLGVKSNKSPDFLRKVELPIIPTEMCQSIYKQKMTIIEDSMICAGNMEHNSCLGDSGGPLSYVLNGKMVVIGLVSFGPNKCGTTVYPSGYTRVSKYIDWISENSHEL